MTLKTWVWALIHSSSKWKKNFFRDSVSFDLFDIKLILSTSTPIIKNKQSHWRWEFLFWVASFQNNVLEIVKMSLVLVSLWKPSVISCKYYYCMLYTQKENSGIIALQHYVLNILWKKITALPLVVQDFNSTCSHSLEFFIFRNQITHCLNSWTFISINKIFQLCTIHLKCWQIRILTWFSVVLLFSFIYCSKCICWRCNIGLAFLVMEDFRINQGP